MPARRLLLAACIAVMLEGACLGLGEWDWPDRQSGSAGRGGHRRGSGRLHRGGIGLRDGRVSRSCGAARRGGPASNAHNFQLNSQIMDCRSAVEVCKLIVARAAEFNHVNVATALRTVLQSRHDGVPRQLVEQALHALEAAALEMIDAFEAQQVASTLHIMAKTEYCPWDPSLVPALEVRAEALAGTFNAQNVANTLWAYATMGREPGAGDRKSVV